MKKQLLGLALTLLVAVSMLLGGALQAEAGNFVQVADTGVLKLKANGKWEKEYRSKMGDVKIRFRNVLNFNDNKRYHLLIWWRDPGTDKYIRVADGYSPKNKFGYGFKVFRDNRTGRVFFAMDAHGRLVLYGYDTFARKLEMYVDSNNYYSPLPLPSMLVRPDGDLELRFDNVNGTANPTRYRLFWDAGSNWFGYEDLNASAYSGASATYDDSVYDTSVRNAPTIYEGVD
ncbi:MAG: hypothetical protein IJ657_01760 [Acidaminococcaceae bacterium]|nr:hypothetical protein [Acidaminococcaceae bacterium]